MLNRVGEVGDIGERRCVVFLYYLSERVLRERSISLTLVGALKNTLRSNSCFFSNSPNECVVVATNWRQIFTCRADVVLAL